MNSFVSVTLYLVQTIISHKGFFPSSEKLIYRSKKEKRFKQQFKKLVFLGGGDLFKTLEEHVVQNEGEKLSTLTKQY